jgi:ABC-type antimicrobial peptide transport system permease subunit
VVSAGPYDLLKDRSVGRVVGDEPARTAPVAGMDAGSLAVLGVTLSSGRLFDNGHVTRHDTVALIPDRMATRLGMSQVGQAIAVDRHKVTVIGFFSDLVRRPDALEAVIMPSTTASDFFAASASSDQITCATLIETRPGAASQLADQVALALAPDAPDTLVVIAPPDPQTFRRTLERPVRLLSLALTAAAMIVGGISVATSISSSVASRAAEIGLRKALGARSPHILIQIVGESSVIGFTGALLGAYLGAYAVIGISLANGWQPILDPTAAALACAAGAALGAVVGLIPATRAARLPAVAALRR